MIDKCETCFGTGLRIYTNDQIAAGIAFGVPGGNGNSDRIWLTRVIKKALDDKDEHYKKLMNP